MPNVTPTFASLSGTMGQQFTLGIGTPVVSNGSADCLEISRKANVSTGGAVSVTDSGSGRSLRVPYLPDRAT